MKVNHKGAQPLINDRTISDLKDAGIKRTKHDAVKSQQLADSTKINLSPEARQIHKATEIAKDQGVDEAKIARLQKLIDGGEYKVDADAIADKLVNEHLIFPSN